MVIKTAQFIGSFPTIQQCPDTTLPEYAFIGRSNVGKSSLINLLTNRNELAKVSGTPGKTQSINYFKINDTWHLVDLPGYGYAKVSKKERERWEKMIRNYLLQREQLACIFVLIDARIAPQKIDLEFVQWLGEKGLPFAFIFTKTDDRKYKAANVEAFKKAILEHWEEMPPYFLTSAEKKRGREDVLAFVENANTALLEQ
ncbi:MAG: YihA family ribosome biogenesis GTP-binding protein [Chitinophagales bacterium]|nr:YihA family ribosome biogenesis GTP-binding protein [Chitinophagales bacterium]